MDLVEFMKANPTAVIFAGLQTCVQVYTLIDRYKCQQRQDALMRGSQREHRESMERMVAENAAFQAEMRKDREKSAKREEELCAARASQLETWESEQKRLQQEQDKRIEKFRKENLEQLEKCRETFSGQLQSSKDLHEQKMRSINEKNRQELLEMKEKQEKAEKKREEKIEADRKFIENLAQEMKNSTRKQNKDVLDMLEKYRKENDELREKNEKLSQQVAKENRKQSRDQHVLMYQMKAVESVKLEQSINNKAMEDIVKKYLDAVEPLRNVMSAIGDMEEFCETAKDDAKTIQPGSLDCFKKSVRQAENVLKYKINSFRQSLITAVNVPDESRQLLNVYVNDIERHVNQTKLAQTCALLTLAYERADFEKMNKEITKLTNFKENLERVKTERISMIMESPGRENDVQSIPPAEQQQPCLTSTSQAAKNKKKKNNNRRK